MSDDMTSCLSSLRSRLPEIESALHAFTSSSAQFRIIRTINPTKTPPKTLYILDSSFNPPSVAHLALAKSAVRSPGARDEKPRRLVLLFSTHNADKAPSPASFEQRLAMMELFAEDLHISLRPGNSSSTQSSSTETMASPPTNRPNPDLSHPSTDEAEDISIDIALTTAPYYTDKSLAIRKATPPPYPPTATHIHLLGFDTITRFLNPKYYTEAKPPLSALSRFFDKEVAGGENRLRVTARPYDESDPASREFGTESEQKRFVERLGEGEDREMENKGWRREWAQSIEVVDAEEGVGVSSTRIRKAAKGQEWHDVGRLCTSGVAGWIRERGLYGEDDRGVKMA
ncbi:Nucleotidylyl transferase [Delitschia confertaspora ATCC 74209]|uniref:Nucleotidylyl transferase n=1 Tax=Delitschia confertaspora ATCC 74209 TaxID=1513339 RepID=A0A9P4MVK5_9PLEO|nr:Nucleotidylyl transferase [Delitschia confertaspora ATCC 74209]